MFSIHDILKKYKEDKGKFQGKQTQGSPELKRAPQENKISVSFVMSKAAETVSDAKARELYEEALSYARKAYRPDLGYAADFIEGINAEVKKIINFLNTDNRELLKLCFADYPELKDYLYFHAVNVCIIAVYIGSGFDYERQDLIELGTAALLHDIGIIRHLDIININGPLGKKEYELIKEHPQAGIEILNKVSKETLSQKILDAVCQEHERIDGSGYPCGLKGAGISEYAQIIGLVDVYEAMLHQRPYRRKYSPFETITVILGDKNAFRHSIIKVLIDKIGIFPVGTPVHLSTKEVAVVIKDNPGFPLRPVVNIFLDANGKRLSETKEVDLVGNAVIYIEG